MRQIYDQLDNIRRQWIFGDTRGARDNVNYQRYRRAVVAAERYVDNITNTDRYSRAYRSGPRRTAEDFNSARDRADRLQFSRRTYMGLNNG